MNLAETTTEAGPYRAAVDPDTELLAIQPAHAWELFRVLDSNRGHLRTWHPWVDMFRSRGDVERLIGDWNRHSEKSGAIHAGIWSQGRLCGMVSTLNVDRMNRWIVLSYWLAADCQGKGIMTSSCRTLIAHAFGPWGMNRVTIESATENLRSRAIPERLGFTLEGTVRGIEKIGDRYVDHALYGLLRSDWERSPLT